MKDRKKKELDTVPDILLSGTDSSFHSVYSLPVHGRYASTVIPEYLTNKSDTKENAQP